MPGIYGMAALTISLTAVLCITALDQLTRSDRRYYGLILAGLPMSFLVNRFVKVPAIAALAAWAGIPLKLGQDTPCWFIFAVWLNAPIFEEALKLLPLTLPISRGFLTDASRALWAGLALGMGFGLGEAGYLAYEIAHSPAYSQMPWFAFTGFAFERLIVTFAHGLLTSISVLGLFHGQRSAFSGFLVAVGFHALINLGPILMALEWIPATFSSLGSYTAILFAFLIFQKLSRLARESLGTGPPEVIYFEH